MGPVLGGVSIYFLVSALRVFPRTREFTRIRIAVWLALVVAVAASVLGVTLIAMMTAELLN